MVEKYVSAEAENVLKINSLLSLTDSVDKKKAK
jgi:hypothetical protein